MPQNALRSSIQGLAALLLFILAGCAGYMPAVIPGEVGNAGTPESAQTYNEDIPISSNRENELIVKVGSEIRLVLLSGEKLEGRVIGLVRGETITVADSGHAGEETVIVVNEVDKIEIRPSSYKASVVTGTFLAVTAGVLGVLGAIWVGGGF